MSAGEIALTIIGSAGGAGVIIAGLAAWLGRVWLSRIVEAEKAIHSRELEFLKSSLESAREHQQRISGARFELYIDVWNHLQDLKTIGDRLWERASLDQVGSLLNALSAVRMAVNRGRLILLEHHYQQLLDVFRTFENYQIGKMRLVQIRSAEELEENYGYEGEGSIQHQIHKNREFKERYEVLLDEIAIQFRDALGLSAQPKAAAYLPDATRQAIR
jgi:hypothetical protein